MPRIARPARKVAISLGASPIVPATVNLTGVSATGGAGVFNTGDVLVSSRTVYNDSSSTWGQESLWLLTEQYIDGTVTAADDLVVKAADLTAFGTQIQSIETYPSGCISICSLWIRVPTGKVTAGANTWGVYKRTQSRSTTSAIVVGDITALNIETEFTNLTDYGGTPDGSGNFKAKVNDFISTGDPMVREIARGPVVRIWQVLATANDVTGGAAQAAGLYVSNWIIGFQSSGGSFAHAYWMPRVHMGDIANSDPDIRRYDVDLWLGGSVIAGSSTGWEQFSDQYLPYYAQSFLATSQGLPWCSDESKRPPFRNIAPFSDWSARTMRRLPPFAANKYDGSGSIWASPSLGDTQAIPTSGGNQGKITVNQNVGSANIWFASNNGADLPGSNWVTFEATSYPTNIVAGQAYCLGADLGSNLFYVYPTRADAIAGTNKVIPSTGTISAGTNVVVYPAHAPMSMPTGYTGWGTGGERAELGVASTVAWMAIMQSTKGHMIALRSNALNLAYVGFQYRGTTTFRVPDIQTDSATYAGLGTGSGTTFSQDARFGGPYGMVLPTPHTPGGWQNDTYSGIAIDINHAPSIDYFYAWLLEPWPWHYDTAMFWAVGNTTWGLSGDRNPTWDSTVVINSGYGAFFDNVRARAWRLRGLLAPVAIWPEAIVAGTNGERPMLNAIRDAQTAQETLMIDFMETETPNGDAMGLLPIQMDAAWATWQYGAYLVSTIGLFYGYTHGLLEDLLVKVKPYGLALAGNTGAASGTMGPTRAGTYYANARTWLTGAGGFDTIFDATASQWDSYGCGSHGFSTTITVNTTTDTVSFYLPPNMPDVVAQGNDNDLITFLKQSSAASIDSAIGFDTPRYIKNLSIDGSDIATFNLSATPGGSTLNLTDATVTSVGWAWHHPSELTSGFWNQSSSPLYPTQNLAATFILSWCLGGMNTEVQAANDALENAQGVGVEPALGIDSKYAYDVNICKE